jgi:hypothetical protein
VLLRAVSCLAVLGQKRQGSDLCYRRDIGRGIRLIVFARHVIILSA